MKIIFVTREGYDLAGARVRCFNFAKELKKRGVEAEVFSYSEDLGAKDGIAEASMTFADKIRHNIMAYKRLLLEKNAVIIIQRVNYHSFAPLFRRLVNKNRIVLDMDDWEIREDPKYLFGFYPTSKAEYLTRKIASMSEFCVAASSYLKDYLAEFNKKVYCIPSCVDADLFKPNEDYKGNAAVKFAWTGTLHRKHDAENVKFMIDCFMELKKEKKDILLDIVGDGIYADEVLLHISESAAAESVNFVKWMHPDKVALYLESIDIGLFPLAQDTKFNVSKSPVKLFEYMAMGKPTVSSSVGESKKIIESGKDGFLAEDKKDFIAGMKLLSENRGIGRAMGLNARKKILSDYSLSIAGDRLFKALKEAEK
jgi:glycosyltransferase involved in cell wall biosynthesis